MKKSIISAFSIILTLIMITLCGCSCSENTLSFKSNWDPQATRKTETLSYSVSYLSSLDKNEDYSLSSSISGLDASIEGTYTVTTSYSDRNTLQAILGERTSNILEKKPQAQILRIQTELNLVSSYTYLGKTENFNEKIITDVFSLDTNEVLAPIYSLTQSKYGIIAINGNTLSASGLNYKSETVFSESSFSGKTEEYNFEDDINSVAPKRTEKYSGSFTKKTLIDNNSLIFAIRNSDFYSEDSFNMQVFSPSFNKGVSVEVAVGGKDTGTLMSEEVPVRKITFAKGGTNSGTPQIIYFQDDKSSRSVPVSMITALSEYSTSYHKIGCLKYTLTNASYN